MTPKQFSGRPVRRTNGRQRRAAAPDPAPMIFDITQSRIEAFNRQNGGGVSVRKLSKGYTLIRDDTGESIARLRSQNDGSQYEVLCKGDTGERWRPVGIAGLILPLDEALEFIAEDPLGCFWE